MYELVITNKYCMWFKYLFRHRDFLIRQVFFSLIFLVITQTQFSILFGLKKPQSNQQTQNYMAMDDTMSKQNKTAMQIHFQHAAHILIMIPVSRNTNEC